MLIAVGSVKGSPGATTLAVTLAAVWPADADPVVMVEADCAGGDVGGRCWLPDTPGLASLATAARAGTVEVEEHAALLNCGAQVVVAPAERQPATVAVGLLAQAGTERWAKEHPTIVDIGRLDPGTPGAELATHADVLLVCAHGDEASLSRLITAGLSAQAAALVLVGGSAYRLQEVREAVGVPVAAVLPWDVRSAQGVWGQVKLGSGWTRRAMPSVATVLARRLADRAAAFDRLPRRSTSSGGGVESWVRAGPRRVT